MTTIVFAYAVPAGLEPVAGAVPWDVLARQLPRWVVNAVNDGRDRGVRYFPFLGVVDGARRFLAPEEPLAGPLLRELHGQDPEPERLVDGLLTRDRLELRLLEGSSGAILQTWSLPFDPLEPLRAARHAAFELCGALGIGGVPAAPPALPGHLVADLLLARDCVLALEAGMPLGPSVEHAVPHALRAWRGAPSDRDLQVLVFDAARLSLRHGLSIEAAVDGLRALAREPSTDVAILRDTARAVQAARRVDALVEVQRARLRRSPDDPELLAEVGGSLVAVGAQSEALAVLRRAVAAGCVDVRVRARLAACEELAGEFARRDALLAELREELDEAAAPPEVLRLLASWSVDRGDYVRAARLVDRGLQATPDHIGLWIERGRSCLGRHRAEEARQALLRARELGPGPEASIEIERLLRVAEDGGLLPELAAVEDLLRGGNLRGALRAARRLSRRHAHVPEVWLLLGIVRQRAGHLLRAIRALRRALSLAPQLAEAHNRLGILLAQRGRDAAGHTHLRRAVELAPDDPVGWIHLAQVAGRLGNVREARQALRRAEDAGGRGEVFEQVRAAVDEAR